MALLTGALLVSLGIGGACLLEDRGSERGTAVAQERTAPGDAGRGREVFQRGNGRCIACSTCHHADRAEVKVGPPLDGIGLRPREEVVDSILHPSARIVPGFETVHVVGLDGPVAGMRRHEDDRQIVLAREDGVLVTVSKETIARDASGRLAVRQDPKSTMPDGYGELLSAQELSDLVAYLMTLKGGLHAAPSAGGAIPSPTETREATPATTIATLRITGMI